VNHIIYIYKHTHKPSDGHNLYVNSTIHNGINSNDTEIDVAAWHHITIEWSKAHAFYNVNLYAINPYGIRWLNNFLLDKFYKKYEQ